MVRVRDLGWRVGSTAIIERVSFDVGPGEFVAVMGRNGAGKSTLLDLMAGLRQPSMGAITVAGTAIDRLTPIERSRVLAHLPQNVRTDRTLTAASLVLMGRYGQPTNRWFDTADDVAIARAAMQRCDCLSFADRAVGTLSGGERQRVLLAACLAQTAGLLLLDEPATFLDVDQQLQCFSVLRAEAERGVACLAVTHDVNLALTFCTRVIVLAERGIAYDSPVSAAVEQPDWLALLSGRMRATAGPRGEPWVLYQ